MNARGNQRTASKPPLRSAAAKSSTNGAKSVPLNGKSIPMNGKATSSAGKSGVANGKPFTPIGKNGKPGAILAPASAANAAAGKPEAKILFQKFFKSVGPRTYAAQIKEAANGNHFLVLTEGKRDEASGEVKKIRLFIFSEDFREFFHMLHETAQFIKANPVSEEVRERRERHWEKKAKEAKAAAREFGGRSR